jgi:hypothetical protein
VFSKFLAEIDRLESKLALLEQELQRNQDVLANVRHGVDVNRNNNNDQLTNNNNNKNDLNNNVRQRTTTAPVQAELPKPKQLLAVKR